MLKLLRKRIAFLMTFLLCFSMVDISSLIISYADEIEETQETVMEETQETVMDSTEESIQEPAETSMEETVGEPVEETASAIETGSFEEFAENTELLEKNTANESDVEETADSPVVRITYENIGDLMALAEYGDGSDDTGWETTEEETSELEYSYGDYTLTYTLMYGNAILTGYSGTLPEKFEIPETIDGYTVTEIDAFAFEFAPITSVVIPETITTIGAYAFYECELLTEVSLTNSISEIEESAFAYSGLTTITLPSSLKQISYALFSGCSDLVSVQIPDSVTAIGSWAFENCSSLESITISDSVTDFGYGVFNGCISLKSVTIPQLEEIPNIMFAGCENLETINLGSKITRIGYGAFRGCTSLKSIDLPDSIEEIDDYAFNRCTSLTSVELPEKLQSVYEGTFKECSSLESVTLGNQVTSIGYKAFADTRSLKTISIPETLTSIGLAAFADSSLSEIGFSGNAPEFELDYDWENEVNLPNNAFTNDTLVVFYPAEDATWTEEVMQTYGGTSVEWVPWDPETEEILAYIDVVDDSVDGEDEYGIHIIGSGDDLVLECNLPLKYFVSVEIDGVTVDPSNYDLKSGSTIITFGSSFLDTLTPGTHTVTMNYNINGRKVAVKTTIVIKEKPNTSDPSSKPEVPSKPTDSSKPADNNGAGSDNGTSASSKNKVNMKTHLVDANGQPMYNCTLEIHSKPVSATLGSDGTASFKNIEVGNHTMYLKDQDGKVLASKAIKIVYDQTYSITGGDTIHVLIGRPFILHVKYDGEKLILLSVEGDQTPATGDSSSAMIWILLMTISAAGFVFLYTRKRKQTP